MNLYSLSKPKIYTAIASVLSLFAASTQTAQSMTSDPEDETTHAKARANELKVALAGPKQFAPKTLPKSPVQKAYHGRSHSSAIGVRG